MAKNFHKPSISVIGGDKRSEILTELLFNSGYDVIYANDNKNLNNALNRRCVILPLPVSRDGINLNSENEIKLVDIISYIHPHTRVLCGGLSDEFKAKIKSTGATAIDYYNVEQVLYDNAYLTAEGTLKLLIENTDTALIDKKILIIGSGRCGKALASILNKLDCNVTITTRKSTINTFSVMERIKTRKTQKISQFISDFDVIVNTAPALVLDREVLKIIDDNALIIELASQSSGVDMNAALELNKKAIYAPALPGKYSPHSAAKVLYNSITQIISEEFA